MKWTPAKDKLLAEVWPTMGQECAYLFPGHTPKGVSNRANVLRIRRAGRKVSKASRPPAPKLIHATRIEFHDDEPLLLRRHDKRTARQCYGFISTGPIPSIWALASAIGGQQP